MRPYLIIVYAIPLYLMGWSRDHSGYATRIGHVVTSRKRERRPEAWPSLTLPGSLAAFPGTAVVPTGAQSSRHTPCAVGVQRRTEMRFVVTRDTGRFFTIQSNGTPSVPTTSAPVGTTAISR